MTQPRRNPSLDDDEIKVLQHLNARFEKEVAIDPSDHLFGYVHVDELQGEARSSIQPTIELLRRRGLVNWLGHGRDVTARYYKITDAGREAIS